MTFDNHTITSQALTIDFSSCDIMKVFVSHSILSLLTLNFLSVLPDKDHISSIITQAGYSSKTHRVETEDGFLLTLHRMKGKRGQALLLMHGILQSASVWVYDGPGKSLAMMLTDAGYDVWMLSARGTAVSAQHKSQTPADEKYWDYSFHDIGFYDLPAAVDVILDKTKQQQIHYVGHSQGGTVFVVFLAMRPEYNQKIKSSYLLAPATFMTNVQGIFSGPLTFSYQYRLEIAEPVRKAGIYSLNGRDFLVTGLTAMFCKINWFVCNIFVDLGLGPHSGQLDDVSLMLM